jgi:hypothetical protein
MVIATPESQCILEDSIDKGYDSIIKIKRNTGLCVEGDNLLAAYNIKGEVITIINTDYLEKPQKTIITRYDMPFCYQENIRVINKLLRQNFEIAKFKRPLAYFFYSFPNAKEEKLMKNPFVKDSHQQLINTVRLILPKAYIIERPYDVGIEQMTINTIDILRTLKDSTVDIEICGSSKEESIEKTFIKTY